MPFLEGGNSEKAAIEIMKELIAKASRKREFCKTFESLEVVNSRDPDYKGQFFSNELLRQALVREPILTRLGPAGEAIRSGILLNPEHIRSLEPTAANAYSLTVLISKGLEGDDCQRFLVSVELNFVGNPYFAFFWDRVNFFGNPVP